MGNAQLGTEARLNLAPGFYYWSVQAVDSAFAGGAFATEANPITVPVPSPAKFYRLFRP